MAIQKIVNKTDTFETQRQTINFIASDVYQVLTGDVALESVDINGVSTTDGILDVRADGAPFVADSFSKLEFRSAKYFIQVVNTSTGDVFTGEYIVTHKGGSTIYTNIIGSVTTTTPAIVSIAFRIAGNNIELFITPALNVSNTTTKISRVLLTL
jgi:hypothetical protein